MTLFQAMKTKHNFLDTEDLRLDNCWDNLSFGSRIIVQNSTFESEGFLKGFHYKSSDWIVKNE